MSKKTKKDKYLHRFTSLPYLLDILSKKRLILVDPNRWEDKNDSYFMRLYKNKIDKKTFLALCFVQYQLEHQLVEKYSHWKLFSGDSSGVCIQFYKNELIEHFRSDLGDCFHSDDVKYYSISKIEENYKKNQIAINHLPFAKQSAFSDEREYRFIYESDEKIEYKPIDINLDFIKGITFNPWVPEPIFKSSCKIINEYNDCNHIQLRRSQCLEYERWKKIGDNIFNS